eukprot:3969523-Alexandrium_andersonii.AAC.1
MDGARLPRNMTMAATCMASTLLDKIGCVARYSRLSKVLEKKHTGALTLTFRERAQSKKYRWTMRNSSSSLSARRCRLSQKRLSDPSSSQ